VFFKIFTSKNNFGEVSVDHLISLFVKILDRFFSCFKNLFFNFLKRSTFQN
jgi:hypothetical protein